MALTIDLTPEQEKLLEAAAKEAGIGVGDYVRELILEHIIPQPRTGAEMLDYMDSLGITGTFADRPDNPEYARQLRAQAEQRERETDMDLRGKESDAA